MTDAPGPADSAPSSARDARVAATFVTLADTLVDDFDPLDQLTTLAQHAVDLLDVTAAGVLLVGAEGDLDVAAASSERARLLEAFAVSLADGPCVDAARTGERVVEEDLTSPRAASRWPRFCSGATQAGYRSAVALPMRLRGQVIGVLSLLHDVRRRLVEPDLLVGQALADAATIALLNERAIRRAEVLNDQLQGALDSRVVIEQAKGVLSRHGGVPPDEAFVALRSRARADGRRLAELAREVVDSDVDLATILPAAS